MHRVKKIEYDDDELYSEEEEGYTEEAQEYTTEERDNFATLTPVVRTELEEAGLQASDREIQDALWHYYWDVGKSVAYLKNSRTPRQQQQQASGKKEKQKSKFDQAAEHSAKTAALDFAQSPIEWFRGVSWFEIPSAMQGQLQPAFCLPQSRLLGGSSKLAKLAEERRKKAAASQSTPTASNGASSSLDRLSRPKDSKENESPSLKAEPRKYPVRNKPKEPPPPPKEPSPPAEQVTKEELPNLRASPTEFGRILSVNPLEAGKPGAVALPDVFAASISQDPFKDPSPDDTVIRAQKHSNTKSNPPTDSLSRKTDALKLDNTPPTPTQPKVKSKGLDVPKLWAEQKPGRKPSAAFVVIGHVDHGKSTLMGRLLLDTGAVSQRDVDKYKKQATELGKASFALAWVMDTGSEERERGVTVDIAQFHFSTDKVDFTILDAPGHRDFVPNMIGGASMADLAVLVVDANQLESGMKGQTREHILLVKACGLGGIIVAVNKLDATIPPWNEAVFLNVVDEVSRFLSEVGFRRDEVMFVACSGLSGQNVVKPISKEGKSAWVANRCETLLEALESFVSDRTTDAAIRQPFRMQITDVFRGGSMNQLSIAGRISAGNVQVGDSVIVQPSGETATIRGIEVGGDGREWAVANQICSLHLNDIDPQHLRAGDFICGAKSSIAVAKSFIARVQVLESLLPQGVDVHAGRLHASGSVAALISTVDAKGEVLKKKPRIVKTGQTANVKLVLEEVAALPPGDTVVLRANGMTVAAGSIERIGG